MAGNTRAAGHKPNATTFKKGQKPWNKGTKGVMKVSSTSYKKGRKSENWLPVGSVRIRCERNDWRRAYIKVAEPNVWLLRCHAVWISAHGPIPEGMLIHHTDRDRLNDKLENLELMSRAEHLNEHREEMRHSTSSN
jgi:hypothetical protein